ncbi:SEC-C motif-containing protein [Sulfurirhabdus autotrophica]|uniref:SEC-C motif-containing protein n=1 Tax=Sulfurirhabdus autotrophica TaxID=1706046 RepID=A0A4R3XT56_9PROT|nr:SEC-C motif-containing protein [Sulfurirhabdus autotrophica]
MELCSCGSNNAFLKCCGRYIKLAEAAPTAEALMRSRYTAFTLNDLDYISRTWHPDTRPGKEDEPSEQLEWLKLEVKATSAGGKDDTEGTVEFVAHYCANGIEGHMQEKSRFIKENGLWFYVDGDCVDQSTIQPHLDKVGRNDLCPCGSRKKYKKCCGK